MSLSVFEWIATLEMALLLLLLWNSNRKLRNLLVQTLNSLNGMRTAVEMTSRSYLGIESAWEGMHREMGEFGIRDLAPLSRERMGAIFVQMLDELRKIRRATTGTSKAPSTENGGEKQ